MCSSWWYRFSHTFPDRMFTRGGDEVCSSGESDVASLVHSHLPVIGTVVL